MVVEGAVGVEGGLSGQTGRHMVDRAHQENQSTSERCSACGGRFTCG